MSIGLSSPVCLPVTTGGASSNSGLGGGSGSGPTVGCIIGLGVGGSGSGPTVGLRGGLGAVGFATGFFL